MFTDFPKKKDVIKRKVNDVWSGWLEDTDADVETMFYVEK